MGWSRLLPQGSSSRICPALNVEEERQAAVLLAAGSVEGETESKLLLCANEGLLRAEINNAGNSELAALLDLGLTSGAVREERAVLVNMNRQRWTGREIWVGWWTTSLARSCGSRVKAAAARNGVRLRRTRRRCGPARPRLYAVARSVRGWQWCSDAARTTCGPRALHHRWLDVRGLVQRRQQRGDEAFSAEDGYFNLFFGDGLSAARAERSPLLQGIRESGVGQAADLEVDTWLRDAGAAPREVREMAVGVELPVLARLQTKVGSMSFDKLGETIGLSDDQTVVYACLEDLAHGRSFLSLWRRRVFFEAAPFIRGRTGAFRRLSRFSYFDDLLDLAEALRDGRHAAEERQRVVMGSITSRRGFIRSLAISLSLMRRASSRAILVHSEALPVARPQRDSGRAS